MGAVNVLGLVMWEQVIAFLSSQSAPYYFCGTIIAVFVLALISGWAKLSALKASIARATAMLKTSDNPQAFYDQFETLGSKFASEPAFANAWNEFSKTVVLDTARLLVRISRRPQEFFNTASVIAPRINLKLFAAMPSYLISLGLFFTFIGLVAAIAIAAQGLAKETELAQTQQALVALLDVASLKFISSVAGISLSILLSFAQKAWLNSVTMQLHRFCSALEQRTQLITTEQLLHQWLVLQQQVGRSQLYLAEDIATEVALQMSKQAAV